jgi:hypothetical protein
MSEYDYQKSIEEACKLLPQLEGALVERILINVVEPEYNVVYLVTDKGTFALQGDIGGEHLGVVSVEHIPEVTEQDGYVVCPYPPFTQFEGHRISQARQIGTAWNGHGFELSFEGVFDRTMIVQSIYAGDKPVALEDCLRLGVAIYSNQMEET